MKIGIMGGTFNPPHNAHLLIAEFAREQYGLGRVIFITGGNPPHKSGAVSAEHRFVMTRLAIAGNDAFTDDSFEIDRSEKSYTVNTLEYLRGRYPSDELFFIIGEDSLNDFGKWYKPRKILGMASLLVFPRKSMTSLTAAIDAAREEYGDGIYPIDAPVTEFSSTDIRERIKSGRSVKYMVPDNVIEYIGENGLYV